MHYYVIRDAYPGNGSLNQGAASWSAAPTAWWVLRRLFIAAIGILFPALIYTKGGGFAPFAIPELVILGVLVAFLMFAIFVAMHESDRRVDHVFAALLVFFFAYQLAVGVVSGSPIGAAASLLLHGKYIVVALLIPIYVVARNDEKKLLQVLLAVGTFTIYLSLVRFGRDPTAILELLASGRFARDSSAFPNPNVYGVYLVTMMFVALGYTTFIKGKKFLGFGAIVFAAPAILVLILTFSRRAWLMFLFGAGLYFLLKRGRRMTALILAAVLIGSVAAYIGTDPIVNRFALTFDSEYRSNTARLREANAQIRFVTSDPVVLLSGGGVGMSGPASSIADAPRWPVFHNYYMQLIVEFGVTGLALYLGLFMVVVGRGIWCLRSGRLMDRDHNRLLLYIVTLVSLYVVGLVGSTPIAFPLSMLQWVVAGLILRASMSPTHIARPA